MGRTWAKFVTSLHLGLALRLVFGCVALGLFAPIIFVLLAWLAVGGLHAALAVLAFCAVLLLQKLLVGIVRWHDLAAYVFTPFMYDGRILSLA